MNRAVAPETLAEIQELTPMQAFLVDLEEVAKRWGGSDYKDEIVDGVYAQRGVRLRGEDSTTMIRYNAERIRRLPQSLEYYTAYTLNIEVTRDIAELPPHVYAEVGKYFGEIAPSLIEEKILTTYHIRDDIKHLEREMEIIYMADGEIMYSLNLDEPEEDDDDEQDEMDDEEPQGGVAVAPQPMSAEEYEALQTEPDQPEEVQLLNDAWELLESAKGRLAADELEFDPAMLVAMARIDKKLVKQEMRMWRLLSAVRLEMQELQVEQCRRVLKKLRPGAPL